MNKNENKQLAAKIRVKIKQLRENGYTYKFFFTAVNYSSMDWYNFMRGYGMTDSNLLILRKLLKTINQ